MENKINDDIILDFKNKTAIIGLVKKLLNNNYSSFKKDIILNTKGTDIKFNDSQLKNAKIKVDSKSRTVILEFPITKTGILTLNENLNFSSIE